MLPTKLIKRLSLAVGIAAVAAVFGWLMVWTGIKGNPLTNPRAWVNAYALSAHLAIGFALFGTLAWATIETWQPNPQVINKTGLKKWAWWITFITSLQIIFGGWMSGMKAGLAYPTFPLMGNEFLPTALLDSSNWEMQNLAQYDHHLFAPALIQFLHRTTAYLLIISILYFWYKLKKHRVSNALRIANNLLLAWIFAQALLGIFTLINCVGHIPVVLGVIHQDGALVLLFLSLFVNYQFINQIENESLVVN
jgi:cytochrome c oxidase assembly protein subunit 15